jgi:hypothetical protein
VDLLADAPARLAAVIPRLRLLQAGAPDLLATQTSAVASVFIYDSGLEALPLGGFTGTIPSPTTAQVRADVAAGRFHLALIGQPDTPALRWIVAHCRTAGQAGQLRNYFCQPSDG